ncbi:MAG: hypothetical protein ACP5QT_00700 [Brevinematia bacterium]
MGIRFQKRLLSCGLLSFRQKGFKEIACILIFSFLISKIYGYDPEKENIIGLQIGRDFENLDFASLDIGFKIRKFYIYGKLDYFLPVQLDIVEEDAQAYRIITTTGVERYKGKASISYGEKINAGIEVETDYYKVNELNIEYYETTILFSGSFTSKYGYLYATFDTKSQFYAGYGYCFNLNRLKYGLEISLFMEENTTLKFSGYLSTFKKDLTISFSYRQGIKYDTAYPFSIGVSKFYNNIDFELSFTPSDIAGSLFSCRIAYHME